MIKADLYNCPHISSPDSLTFYKEILNPAFSSGLKMVDMAKVFTVKISHKVPVLKETACKYQNIFCCEFLTAEDNFLK